VRRADPAVFGRVAIAFIAVFFLTLALKFIDFPNSGAPDFPCVKSSGDSVLVEIASGESGSSIGKKLFNQGVIKSSDAFFRVAVGDTRSQRIAPGAHSIDVGICAKDALDQLLDPLRIQGLINITEGSWVSEILPQFYRAGYSRSDVMHAIQKATRPVGFSTIEGILFPAQYSFAEGESAQVAIQTMISRAESEMRKAGFFNSKGTFTPQQLLVIASLVQAEGNLQDFAKISQVIRNRLKIGMPLQFDSTVHYIKKTRGSVFLSSQSTLIKSEYNTYQRYGLPPGPINNPGIAAMNAALNPATGDWIYFITVAPGDTRFTKDSEQFGKWKVEYKANLRKGLFRSGK
jgi:UPF0755 protein